MLKFRLSRKISKNARKHILRMVLGNLNGLPWKQVVAVKIPLAVWLARRQQLLPYGKIETDDLPLQIPTS